MNLTKYLFLVLATIMSLATFAQESESAEADTDYIEEVVTATSRETTILEVPYNISTLSGDEIGARTILDEGELLRNFVGISTIDRGYRNAGTTSNVRIRGLNVDSSLLQDYPVSADASVSTYVDKTPVFANFLLRDLDRVEVLRGPQGTLYGSGALGGTIRYITNDPILGLRDGGVTYTASSVDGSDGIGNAVDAMFNIPIGDRMAYRLVLSHLDYPGITDYVNIYETTDVPDIGGAGANLGIPVTGDYGFPGFFTAPPSVGSAEDADTVGVEFMRHKFYIDVNDKMDVMFMAINQEDDIGGRRQASIGTKYVLNDSCTSLLAANCYDESTYGKYENGALMLEPSSREVSMESVEITYDFPFHDLELTASQYDRSGESTTDNTGFFAGTGTFTSPAYGYFSDVFAVGDIFGVPPRPYAPTERQYENSAEVVELKLITDIGYFDKFDYVVGLFQKTEDQSRAQQTYVKGANLWNYYYWGVDYIVDPNEQDFDYNVREIITNEASYGEFTYHYTDEVDITLGIRNYNVEASAAMNSAFKLYDVFPVSDTDFNTDKGTLNKVNVSYRPSGKNQNYYFTSSEGYRRGGVNAVPTEGPLAEDAGWVPFESDTVKNIELGVKGALADGTYYNLSYFMVDWDNPQLNTSTPVNGYYAVVNGDTAQINGFDVELSGSAGAIDWNVGYSNKNARLSSDFYTPADTPVLYARSGAKLPGSPDHTFNLNLAHTSYFGKTDDILSGMGMVNRLDLYAQSSTRNYIGDNSAYDAEFDGFNIINASSTIFNDDMYVSLFIKNLTNERGTTGAFLNEAFGPQPSQGFYGSNSREFYALPRTIGFSISRGF